MARCRVLSCPWAAPGAVHWSLVPPSMALPQSSVVLRWLEENRGVARVTLGWGGCGAPATVYQLLLLEAPATGLSLPRLLLHRLEGRAFPLVSLLVRVAVWTGHLLSCRALSASL